MSVQKRRRSFAFLNRDASSISFSFSDLSDFRAELMPALHKQLSCLAGQKRINRKFIRRLNPPKNGPFSVIINKQISPLRSQHNEIGLFDLRADSFRRAKLLAD